MTSTEQPGFLVHVANRTEVTAKDLKVCVLPDVVLCHFEHAKVKVCDWAEGTTCDKDYWDFIWVLECPRETLMGKSVVRGVCEGLCEVGGESHGDGEARGEGKKGTVVVNASLIQATYKQARQFSGVKGFPTLLPHSSLESCCNPDRPPIRLTLLNLRNQPILSRPVQ